MTADASAGCAREPSPATCRAHSDNHAAALAARAGGARRPAHAPLSPLFLGDDPRVELEAAAGGVRR